MDSDLTHAAIERFEALEARVAALETATGHTPTDPTILAEEAEEKPYEENEE